MLRIQKPAQELHFIKNPRDELRSLYANLFLNNFALSLFNIFIIIFLLELNYSIYIISLFMIEVYLLWFLLTIPTTRLVSRWGKKKMIIISTPLALLQIFLIYNLESFPILLFTIPIFWALSRVFYWLPLNTHFSENAGGKVFSKNLSILVIAARIGAVFGPTVGGLIASNYSFEALFLVASVVLVLSAIPLLKSGDEKSYVKINLKKMLWRDIKLFDAFFLEGFIFSISFVFLNIYVYLNTSLIFLGVVNTLSLLVGFLLIMLIGFMSDNIDKPQIIKWSSMATAILWLLFMFTKENYMLVLLFVLYGLANIALSLPLFTLAFANRSKEECLGLMSLRELSLNIGACFGIIFVFFIPRDYLFQGIFFLGFLASMYLSTIRFEKRVEV